jgi:hypothetical protein
MMDTSNNDMIYVETVVGVKTRTAQEHKADLARNGFQWKEDSTKPISHAWLWLSVAKHIKYGYIKEMYDDESYHVFQFVFYLAFLDDNEDNNLTVNDSRAYEMFERIDVKY